MAVKMTADQFHALTRLRLHQVWPERRGRGKMDVTMMADQLHTILATQWGIGGGGAAGMAGAAKMFEATREGEVAAPAHTYGRVGESTEQSQPKQDQVRPGTRLGQVGTGTRHGRDIEATRDGRGQRQPTPMNRWRRARS